jgi:hypothetical protein
MHPEMKNRIGTVGIAKPQIELRKGVRGRETFFNSNRIGSPSYPNAGCTPTKTLPKLLTQTNTPAPVRLHFTGCRTPCVFDRSKRGRIGDDMIGADVIATLASCPY